MLSISKMSLAVALAIAIGNNAFADNTVAEDNKNNKAQDNTTTNTDGLKVSTTIVEDDDKIDPEELSIFAAKTVLRMQSDTSKKYLKNTKVADVSTFPMRLVAKLSQDPWQKAPNLTFIPVCPDFTEVQELNPVIITIKPIKPIIIPFIFLFIIFSFFLIF